MGHEDAQIVAFQDGTLIFGHSTKDVVRTEWVDKNDTTEAEEEE